jgi:Ca-activated chloride channel family protein
MPTHPLLRTLQIAGIAFVLFLPFSVHAAPCGLCYAQGEDGQRIIVPLESTEVVLDVKPGLVEAEVTQTFTNRTNTALEATYLYPLPHDATITDVELRYPDHIVKSVVREKKQARQEYETAKSEGKKAALIEQHDPSLFSTAVANFLPGEKVQVVFRFNQPLTISARSVEIRFPMVTGEKYFLSEPTSDPKKPAVPIPPKVDVGAVDSHHVYAYDITISGVPATTIESPSHKIQVQTLDGDLYRVALAEDITIPDRDFVLRIETKPVSKTTPTVVTQQTPSGNYGLLTLFPPLTTPISARAQEGHDFLFLIDHSGSMQGPRISSARLGLQATLQSLVSQDRFQIVIFDSEYSFYKDEWTSASPDQVTKAIDYVSKIQANSGTEMQKALNASLDFIRARETKRQSIIIFLTDGDVGNEDPLLKLLESKIGNSRLFTFGIGEAPNNFLINKMAELGRGQARFISDDNSVARELEDLFATLEAPVLTDLRLSFMDAQGMPLPVTLFPKTPNHVFAGRPVQSVFSTDAGIPSTVLLEGCEDGKPIQIRLPLSLSVVRGFGIEKYFGRLAYDELESQRRRASSSELRGPLQAEMLRIALQYQLVTEYTSRVAIEQKISRDPNAPLRTEAVAQYHAHDQQVSGSGDDEFIVLSPFEVSTDTDSGYTCSQCLAGTRVRTNLRDVGTSISVVTRQFLDDFAVLKPEDLSPYVVLPESAPGIANSAAETSLLNELSIATVIDVATIERVNFSGVGMGPNSIDQQAASTRHSNSIVTQMGDRGIATATLKSDFSFTSDGKTPTLVVVSGSQFDKAQWSALVNSRKEFGADQLQSSLQCRSMDGYGKMQLANFSFTHSFTSTQWFETDLAWHDLRRENPRQFELRSPSQQYDGLGLFNLDLLTAETRRLQDLIANIRVGGKNQGTTVSQSWSAGAGWHRQAMDSLDPLGSNAIARQRDEFNANAIYEIRSRDERLALKTEIGASEFSLKNESSQHKSSYKLAETVSWELTRGVRAFVAADEQTLLPFASTGEVAISNGEVRSVTSSVEDRKNLQTGIQLSLLDGRIAGEFSIFHTSISGQSYRDWAWEKSHDENTTVVLPSGILRLPVSYGVWNRYEQNGFTGSLNFSLTREITGIVSWYDGWDDNGPYHGGNRRASVAVRYSFYQGMLKNFALGCAISSRNTIVYNDGYELRGGIRSDLFLGYQVHLFGQKRTQFQLNLIDLNNSSWQPTRFANDRGRQFLFSIGQDF